MKKASARINSGFFALLLFCQRAAVSVFLLTRLVFRTYVFLIKKVIISIFLGIYRPFLFFVQRMVNGVIEVKDRFFKFATSCVDILKQVYVSLEGLVLICIRRVNDKSVSFVLALSEFFSKSTKTANIMLNNFILSIVSTFLKLKKFVFSTSLFLQIFIKDVATQGVVYGLTISRFLLTRWKRVDALLPICCAVAICFGLVFSIRNVGVVNPTMNKQKLVKKTRNLAVYPQLAANEEATNLGLKINEVSSDTVIERKPEKIDVKIKPNAKIVKLLQTKETAIDTQTPIYVMVHPKEKTTFSNEDTARVMSIVSKEGERFKAGDVLVTFDCRVQQADLKRALSHQKSAYNAYNSAARLNSFDSISKFEVIKAESEAEMASAEVDKQKAVVDNCILKAPYDGSVSETIKHPGEIVKPGEHVLKIVNSVNLELKMQVPSAWINWLKIGLIFHVKINELNKVITAKVVKIYPEINSVSQTVTVVGAEITSDPQLLPGMSGLAIFEKDFTDNDVKAGGLR